MRLIQFLTDTGARGVARIEGSRAIIVKGATSVIALAQQAIAAGHSLDEAVKRAGEGEALDYPALLSRGRVLAPVDHPDATHCLVTGTGLTHLGSADARDKMHKKIAGDVESLSDSMKMFRMGLEGGKPQGAGPGVQPEWFYKGDGSCVVAPGADLPLPDFALDGGEEPEIAGLYLVDSQGKPWRLGFALGNEYSDHVMERQNYLYLAHSKLRACAIGPELRTGPLPDKVEGESRVVRKGEVIWRKPFLSGEGNMSHTIANLEYHHFKYGQFRRPGDLHVHFFGTATLSFSDGIRAESGDVFEIEIAEFGAPLRNRLAPATGSFAYGGVGAL
ncbi:AraD1 family protein [Dongia deserti]|uniref:AraD1 family protein n=1 Tax=Dongia deserti TaxID=2268030 RepID=UPI000E64AC9F|nr:AraD1 family protein [Dongia deserti]